MARKSPFFCFPSLVALLCLLVASSTVSAQCGQSERSEVFQSSLGYMQLIDCMNPTGANCDWYTRCMEMARPCGPTGYVMSFGYPYCQKFAAAKDLSPIGVQWRDKTMNCLQKALVPMLGASGPFSKVCAEIEQTGFDSHVECYTSTPSICSLPWPDLFNIMSIVGPGFLNPTGYSQAAKVVSMCLCQWSGLC